MKKGIHILITACFSMLVLFTAILFSCCAAKKPAEKIYVLSRDRDAVWLVSAEDSEKVLDVPEDALSAALSGRTLWYANETSLMRLGLADGSRREYEIPEDEWKERIVAFEDEAYSQYNP